MTPEGEQALRKGDPSKLYADGFAPDFDLPSSFGGASSSAADVVRGRSSSDRSVSLSDSSCSDSYVTAA